MVSKEKTYAFPRLKYPIALGAADNCPGCSHGLLQRLVCDLLDEEGWAGDAVGVAGVGCGFGFFGLVNIDGCNCAHGAAPAVATAIKHAHFGKKLVFTIQGDGDCLAIGGGYLLNAAARAERVTVIMLNNANYGTTGGQMAPTTPLGMRTTPSPEGRDPKLHGFPLHASEFLATMQGVVYAARGALSSPANYQRAKRYIRTALQKQLNDEGFTFVELLGICPPDWHMEPVAALDYVEDKITAEYPLGEFKK